MVMPREIGECEETLAGFLLQCNKNGAIAPASSPIANYFSYL
jgi:hypothetical protein